jgi:opacity protein-like surface antigen
VGGGVELPVGPSVSAKFEYLYVDFGQFGFSNAIVPQEQFTFTEQILRAGMNLKLN